MKKNIALILLVSFCIAFTECKHQKETAYYIPDEYTGQTRANFIAMLENGQKLYKLHCAGCHGIFTKGKDSIPNFSKTQIENYAASALSDDPKNHSVAKKIRPYDLDLILQFLSYRKQSGKK